jgi:hypothetical protein
MDHASRQIEIASGWRRLGAAILDSLILSIVAWVWLPTGAAVAGWLIVIAYNLVSNSVGLSPGKYYAKTYIQTLDGHRPGIVRGVARSADTLVRFGLFFVVPPEGWVVVCVASYALYLPILSHEQRRSLLDQLAGTVVLRGRRVAAPGIAVP